MFCPASIRGSKFFSSSGEGMGLGSDRDFLRSVDGQLSMVHVSLLLRHRTARRKNYYFVNLKAVQSWILCNYILALTNHIWLSSTAFTSPASLEPGIVMWHSSDQSDLSMNLPERLRESFCSFKKGTDVAAATYALSFPLPIPCFYCSLERGFAAIAVVANSPPKAKRQENCQGRSPDITELLNESQHLPTPRIQILHENRHLGL